MTITLEELLALPNASETLEDVTIPGIGMVKIRALSLAVHHDMREDCSKGEAFNTARWETLMLVNGLAEPTVTFDQATALRKKVVGPVNKLLEAVLRISGLTTGGVVAQEAVDKAEETFQPEPDTVQ